MTETIDRTSAAPADGPDRLTRRDVTVITVLLVSAFVVVLNETIMSVAIPVLIKDLGVSASTGQWLSTGFVLTMAVVIPVSGFLIQRLTTRTLFAAALGSFVLGTLIAALAPVFGVLLAGRIVQGIGAAIITPLLMTTIMTIVPESRRGQMMGNVSIVISVAPAIGPTVSGFILSVLPWSFIFWCVLPFAVAGLVLGLRFMENIGEVKHVPIDWVSIPLAALGFGGLVYGLNAVGESASDGGSSPLEIVVPLVLGALGLLAFLLRQVRLQRDDTALFDLRPFRSTVFTASVTSGALAFLGLLGQAILLPLYLQNVLHLSTLETGLLVLPGGLLMGVLGPVVGRLYDRFGPRPLLIPGLAIATVALALLGLTLTPSTPAWQVLLCHMLLSVGLATVLPSVFTAGLSAVPQRFTSYGSAIFATVQQVGGAAGTALGVTLLAVGSAGWSGPGGTGAAEASGVRLAFLVFAAVFVAAIAIGALVTGTKGAAPVHGAH